MGLKSATRTTLTPMDHPGGPLVEVSEGDGRGGVGVGVGEDSLGVVIYVICGRY